MYPALNTVQQNTSTVDIADPDYHKHPLFRELQPRALSNVLLKHNHSNRDEKEEKCHGDLQENLETDEGAVIPPNSVVLSAGDALFIPFKWWHYCRSIDTNASVNYW